MSEFEVKPPRTSTEQLVSALSIKAAPVSRDGGGGIPALEPCHYAAMLAGIRGDIILKRMVEQILYGKYLGRPEYVKMLGDTSYHWIASQALMRFPSLETSGLVLRKVSRLAAECFCHDENPSVRLAKKHGLSRGRWSSHEVIYRTLIDRLLVLEDRLADQANRELRACVP